MKKILGLVLVSVLFSVGAEAQVTNAQFAQKIAQRMKDSLQLTQQQQTTVYTINLELAEKKQQVRQQTTQQDTLRMNIQKVENMRDSLYKAVLTNEQYLLYRQKKRNLINNN